MKGHSGAIFCAAVSDETLYTGSVDKTVRMWNLQLIMAPKAYLQCYTLKRLQELVEAKVDLKQEDCYDRNLLMLLCSFGLPSLAPTIKGGR